MTMQSTLPRDVAAQPVTMMILQRKTQLNVGTVEFLLNSEFDDEHENDAESLAVLDCVNVLDRAKVYRAIGA